MIGTDYRGQSGFHSAPEAHWGAPHHDKGISFCVESSSGTEYLHSLQKVPNLGSILWHPSMDRGRVEASGTVPLQECRQGGRKGPGTTPSEPPSVLFNRQISRCLPHLKGHGHAHLRYLDLFFFFSASNLPLPSDHQLTPKRRHQSLLSYVITVQIKGTGRPRSERSLISPSNNDGNITTLFLSRALLEDTRR